MSPSSIAASLADVSEDFYRALTRMETLSYADRGALEALWVRLDTLVEQLPDSLHTQTYGD